MPYLESLIPSSVVAWYPLEDAYEEAQLATAGMADESGNSRDLAPSSIGIGDQPTYKAVESTINNRPSLIFNGEPPLLWDTAFSAKDIFILTKYTLAANFGAAYRGLISDEATNALLIGQELTTRFFDLSPLVFTYRKSQTAHAAGSMAAPFTNFELVELYSNTGWSLDGLQLGQDRADTDRRWFGRVAEVMLFSSVLTAAERKRVELYFDLKFHLWLLNNTTLNFPSPDITGIYYNRFYRVPSDWESITRSHEYEDGGRSFATTSDTPKIEWELGFTGLSPEQAEVFDAFDNAARRDRTFSFTDKHGETFTGVRIVEYSRNHDAHKSWINEVRFRLCKYP